MTTQEIEAEEMKIKIFEEESPSKLEDRINYYLSFLNQLGESVIDIKYTGSGCYTPYGSKCYSAMIILEDQVRVENDIRFKNEV